MLKAFSNLLIILLICIGASGIPIFYSPVINQDTSIYADNEEVILSASTDADDLLFNPDSIFIKYKTNRNAVVNLDEYYQFTAKIFKNEEIYKVQNIRTESPTQIEFTKDTPYSVSIDISKKSLDLPNGEYRIEISPNIVNNSLMAEPLVLSVKYLSNVPYVPAVSTIPDGKMALKLYFIDPNNSVKQLIGITRFVDYNKRPLATIVDELKKGPSLELGLNMNPIIGNYNYVSLKGTTAYIDLPSKESIYSDGNGKSEIAMNSLIKSIGSYPGVENVRFLVDYNKAKTFFDGQDITKSFNYDIENKVFLAYDSISRYFLVECDVEDISEEMTIENKANVIFENLKNTKYDYLSSTIPPDIELINSRLENDTLILNFSSNFLNAYNNDNNLNRMMLDSILFSFTSLKEVNKVRFLVDGEFVNRFADVDLSKDMIRPLYINPEN